MRRDGLRKSMCRPLRSCEGHGRPSGSSRPVQPNGKALKSFRKKNRAGFHARDPDRMHAQKTRGLVSEAY